jgi:hypothetical protein
VKALEKKLLEVFRALSGEQQQSLLDFAAFLASRTPLVESAVLQEPLPIPRPENETLIKAIKRLGATYPMLDRSKLLHETSAFVTQHVMHGRPAEEMIDELELVFQRHYEQLKGGGV